MANAAEIAALPSVVIPFPIAVSLVHAIRSKRFNGVISDRNLTVQREDDQGCCVAFESRRHHIYLALFAVISFGGIVFGVIAVIFLFVDHRGPVWWAVLLAALPLSLLWSPSLQKLTTSFEKVEKEKQSARRQSARWMAGIINGAVKLSSVIGFAVLMLHTCIVHKRQQCVLSHISTAWQYVAPFVFALGSSLCAYLLSWLAFRIKMHFAGVYAPLFLASFASIILLFYPSFPCSTLNVTVAAKYCDKSHHDGVWMALVFLAIAELCAVVTIAVCRRKTHPLVREEDLFIHPCYNGPFLGQTVLLNLKTTLNFAQLSVNKNEVTVIIASTMYHESPDEQTKLFRSIQKLYENQNSLPRSKEGGTSGYKFEWHILFDDAVDKTSGDCNKHVKTLLDIFKRNGANLLSRNDDLPYGRQIKVRLNGGDVEGDDANKPIFPVVIHLKDTSKWKQKKRWSQVMYLQYILNFRCNLKSNCTNKLEKEKTYILTTDGDVNFSPTAVDVLLDRLNMDAKVGSVSGRVYPVGEGFVVWYQQFEYAAGYWLQKVAEHVFGTVMCSPGCFSAFRVEALNEVLEEYSKTAKTANDFLKMDMGEDRWLSTLLIRKGWRLDYAASSKCETKCPDSFDDFYKQRRRWIPSTLANIFYLGSESKSIWHTNEAFPLTYILYLIIFILSTIVGPSTILLVMAAGLEYSIGSATDTRYVLMLVSLYGFALVIFFYVWVCFYCCESTQLFVAKVLTFFFAFVMAGVLVGVVLQVAQGLHFRTATPTAHPIIIIPPGGPNVSSVYESISLLGNSSTVSDKLKSIAISTWYLGGILFIFVIAALLHISDIFVLFKGILYLFCLPSGFILMTAFALCNLTNQSWGTRVKSEKSEIEGKTLHRRFLEGLAILRIYCCCCCKELDLERGKENDEDKNEEPKDDEEEDPKLEDDSGIAAELPVINDEKELDVDEKKAREDKIKKLKDEKEFWENVSESDEIDIRAKGRQRGEKG